MLKALKYILGFLVTYYMSAVIEKRLFLFDTVLQPDISKAILGVGWKAIAGILLFNIFLVFIDDWREMSRRKRYSATPIYNEICKILYEKCIESNSQIEKHKTRLSIHKGILNTFKCIRIINVGRYQHSSPWRLSNIKYRNGQGCAGMCFKNNISTEINIECDGNIGYFKYLWQSKKQTRLSFFKTLLLHERSISIKSIPILDKERRPWGVLTIDGRQPGIAAKIDSRMIETELKEFAYIFNDREVQ